MAIDPAKYGWSAGDVEFLSDEEEETEQAEDAVAVAVGNADPDLLAFSRWLAETPTDA